MEEDEEDVEEIQGQIKPYEDEPLADSEADAGYEREIACSQFMVCVIFILYVMHTQSCKVDRGFFSFLVVTLSLGPYRI